MLYHFEKRQRHLVIVSGSERIFSTMEQLVKNKLKDCFKSSNLSKQASKMMKKEDEHLMIIFLATVEDDKILRTRTWLKYSMPWSPIALKYLCKVWRLSRRVSINSNNKAIGFKDLQNRFREMRRNSISENSHQWR